MSLATLAAGSTLPRHRVSAQMPADVTENKIHEDGLARELGFRGGLVPGVTVYAWMTHPVVAALGVPWLERGTFRARFQSPVYFDEPVVIEAAVAARTGQGVEIEVRAVNGAGELCATATFGLTEGASAGRTRSGKLPGGAAARRAPAGEPGDPGRPARAGHARACPGRGDGAGLPRPRRRAARALSAARPLPPIPGCICTRPIGP